MPYAIATSTIGASWSGASVQLVSSEGSSTLPGVRLQPDPVVRFEPRHRVRLKPDPCPSATVDSTHGERAPDLRGGGGLDREGRRRRRTLAGGRGVHGGQRVRRVRGTASTRRHASPRGLHGLGRDEARARSEARRPPQLRCRPRRPLHQRRADLRRRAAPLPRLRRGEPDRARAGRRARRRRGRGVPRGRGRARRRRDRGASRDLQGRASSTSPAPASESSSATR